MHGCMCICDRARMCIYGSWCKMYFFPIVFMKSLKDTAVQLIKSSEYYYTCNERQGWNTETTYIHTKKEWAAQKQKLDPLIHSHFFGKIRFLYLESWKSDSRSWCILHQRWPLRGSGSHSPFRDTYPTLNYLGQTIRKVPLWNGQITKEVVSSEGQWYGNNLARVTRPHSLTGEFQVGFHSLSDFSHS